jgi:hypothetical protein
MGNHLFSSARSGLGSSKNNRRRLLFSWGKLGVLTILAVYFYVFMEWLFYATKPSFMDLMPIWTKLGILLLSGLLIAGICLALVLVLFALSLVPWWSKYWKGFLAVGGMLPAVFIAITALLLADNFTYTVFKFGIVSTQGIQRGLYGVGFLLVLAASTWWMDRILREQTRKKRLKVSLNFQTSLCTALILFSPLMAGSLYITDKAPAVEATSDTANSRPNILLIGSDGLLADHLSLYGSANDTTPFLKTLAPTSLLAENNFPNATITTGSVVSIFTSKLPMETRVIYPPNILHGSDAIEHLPGVLKSAGYYNAEISVNYYVDPDVLNLQNSFVMVNGDSNTIGRMYTFTRRYIPEDSAYFLSNIAKRISDRVLQISYLRSMPDPYGEVIENEKLSDMTDQDRLGMIKSLFRDIHQPLFIHAHLMGTHSADTPAAYDEEVKAFDGYMSGLMTDLQQMGKLDNTVVIVYTDHGFGDVSNVRIPLMIHFPGGKYAGKIIHNTQNLDIAPTILDYLGIKPPAWMEGESLLNGEPAANRPIFSAAPSFRADSEFHRLELDLSKVRPPFYQFGTIGMVICQKWYAVDTASLTWQEANIVDYPTPCGQNSLPNDRQAQQIMLDQLTQNGFDVTTLKAALEKTPSN